MQSSMLAILQFDNEAVGVVHGFHSFAGERHPKLEAMYPLDPKAPCTHTVYT